ncbi:MAG TPA: PEGA domain-containing protein [Kofleriaceae bacterium]|nr:PEGA domain-containing protein [Kofleriaceae bacterium]
MSTEKKTKGMCIATRCTSVDQFVQMFARFVDEESFFVSTHNTRPAGLETSFSVQLADGTPVLRGLCTVLAAWTDANNVFKTPGVRLGIKRLTASSMPVFERLLVTRSAPTPPPIPKRASDRDKTTELKREMEDVKTSVVPPKLPPPPPVPELEPDDEPEIETRTPGSDYILPANPLMNLSDASLDGFVDCTLYEETGNFFPAEDNLDDPMLTDDVVPPPVLATRRPTTAPVVLPANPLAPEVTISSVVAPLPGDSIAALLPTEPVASNSVVTPLPLSTSVVTPLPSYGPMPTIPPPMSTMPPMRETPIPVGERIDLAPRARRKKPPMWMLGGGFGVIAIATLIIVISGKSSSGSSATKPAKQIKPEVVAQVELPKPEQPVVEEATDTAATTEAKTGVLEDPDGPPMVGDGPCKLTVATTPAGSMIALDGKELAPSPLTIATSCEKHKIGIAHARYQSATKMITLVEGTPGAIDVSLNRPTHAVSITSLPQGATIFIDGRRAGTTPTVVNVVGFQRLKIEVKKTGFVAQSVSLYSKLAQDKVSVRLKK